MTLAPAGAAVMAADGFERALELMQRQDFATAAPILKRLAEEGHVDAQGYYGGLLLAGVPGIPHDVVAAQSWLEKAAGGGNALAAFNLGLMSERGDGVPADASQAVRWYDVAAKRGLPVAMLKLGQAYREGRGVAGNAGEAARWLRGAADAGDPDAQNLLGVMIAKEEVPGSRPEAYLWFLLANRAGQPDAAKNLELLRPSLSADEAIDSHRRAAQWRPVLAR